MVYYLGIPAKVIYRATGFASGYQDVHGIVQRPDGEQFLVPLNEMAPPFSGIYWGILNTALDDPVGDYVVEVVSVEDGRRDVTRMSFYPQPASQASIDQLSLKVQNLIDIIEIFTL